MQKHTHKKVRQPRDALEEDGKRRRQKEWSCSFKGEKIMKEMDRKESWKCERRRVPYEQNGGWWESYEVKRLDIQGEGHLKGHSGDVSGGGGE